MTERGPRGALVAAALSAAAQLALPSPARADGPDASAPARADGPDASAPAADAPAPDLTAQGDASVAPDPDATVVAPVERAPPPPPVATPALPVVASPPARPLPAAREQGVTVLGSSLRALERVPGSSTVVSREDLRYMAPQHGGDALRTVPGVHVSSEDAMGLRLNIGIRGLDPNRSRKVLVLEDGMPVSLNPYGSPELYYTPPIERMDHIEVLRGSGQLIYGPQSIGGAINYVTREPPRTPSAGVDLRYGTYGYAVAHGTAGATHGPVGWRLDVLHRRFDGPRHLDLALTDVDGRVRFELSPRALVRLKLNFYDEDSRTTYIGPTTSQFTNDRNTSTAEHDRFRVRRYAVAMMHQYRFSDAVRLQTNFYAYQTNRAWRRQEFDRSDMGDDYERICDPTGRCAAPGSAQIAPTNDGGSVFFQQSAAIRNRRFEVAGIEPRLSWDWRASDAVTGELTALARLHYETAHEQVLVTSFPTANAGDPEEEEVRRGYALAALLQNRFSFWRRFHVTPALRVENFWASREVLRVPVTDAMGVTRGADTEIYGRTFTWALIPGLGLNYEATRALAFYGGVHRGYAPPRTIDAVSPAGMNLRLDPELSWNFELGSRLRLRRWLTADVAGFLIEYENQIIPPNEVPGMVAGNAFNTGHSRQAGVEASATFDLASLLGAGDFALPLTVNYTWLPLAAFVGGLFDGNRLPYAPGHLFYAQLRFVHRTGFAAQASVNYVASQFADKENTSFASIDGLVGALPGYANVDLRVAYTFRRASVTVSLTGRNLTDQVYIASRAPQGIQPAGYRQIFAGLEWAWPSS